METTDFVADRPNPEPLPACDYCDRRFDLSHEGHIDEATSLAFCGLVCEMDYDRMFGLPDEYEL